MLCCFALCWACCVSKPSVDQHRLAERIAALTPAACQRDRLSQTLPDCFRGRSHLGVYFALRCFQRLSRPDMATRRLLLAEQPVHQRSVHPGPLVLGTDPRKLPAPATDRDRTVSRRSEPSSRTALIGEQPNPWDRIQPQDTTSRHRGAKPCRRCERLGKISLLSPG